MSSEVGTFISGCRSLSPTILQQRSGNKLIDRVANL